MAGLTGMHASLNMFLDIGIEIIRKELLKLTDELIEMLKYRPEVTIVTPVHKANRSGILTFSRQSDALPDDVVERLKQKNIIISAREGLYRIAPHFYNTTDELEHTINQLFK